MEPNKILLRNLPPHVDNELLDLLFTHQRYGDNIAIIGITTEKESDQQSNYAVIEFDNEQIPKNIIKYGTIEFKSVKYEPQLFNRKMLPNQVDENNNNDAESDAAILLENIDKNRIETILVLFENSKKSGGGKIKKHVLDDETGDLVIYFEEKSVAENVLNIGEIKFSNQIFRPVRYTKKQDSSEILVENVAPDQLEVLLLYYESEKRSGGDEYLEYKYDEDKKSLTIKYKSPDIAKRVLNFGPITCNGKTYVSLPPHSKNNNFAQSTQNIASEITETKKSSDIKVDFDHKLIKLIFSSQDDSNYFEDLTDEIVNIYIQALLYSESFIFYKMDCNLPEINIEDNAISYLINSDDEIDFDSLKRRIKKIRTLMKKSVDYERVYESGCIIVRTNKNSDNVREYFSNEKRSGGGEIEILKKIECAVLKTNLFIIKFEDKRCVGNILSKTHNNELQIKPFYGNIEGFEKKVLPKLEEFSYMGNYSKLDIEKHKFPYSFVLKFQHSIEKFKEFLAQHGAKLSDELQIVYHQRNVTHERLIAHLNQFEKLFVFHEWSLDTNTFIRIKSQLEPFYSNHSDIHIIYFDGAENEQSKVRIEGYEDSLKTHISRIENIVKEEKNKKKDDKVENLTPIQCSLLLKHDFIKDIREKYPELTVKIIEAKGTAIFTGIDQYVLFGKQKLEDVLKTIKQKQTDIPFLLAKYLKDYKEFVDTGFEKENIKVEYEVFYDYAALMQNESFEDLVKLVFYAIQIEQLSLAKEFISKSFILKAIDLKTESLPLLDDLYPKFKETIEKERKEAKNEHPIIFAESKIKKRFFVLDSDENIQYLDIVKSAEIQQTCTNIFREKNEYASVIFETSKRDPFNTRVKIMGNDTMRARLVAELQSFTENKIYDKYEIKDPVDIEIFKDENNKESLNTIQRKTKCLIMKASEDFEKKIKNELEKAERNKNCIYDYQVLETRIKILNSKITEINYSDAIVVASDTNFNPLDDCSRLILNNAGDELKEDLKLIGDDAEFFEGKVCSTGSGALRNCNSLIHAFIPKNTQDRNELKFLSDCITESLIYAENSKCRSISFPVFYADLKPNSNEFIRLVLDATFNPIIDYLVEHPETCLRNIYINDDVYSHLAQSSLTDAVKHQGGILKRSKTFYRKKEIISTEIGSLVDVKNFDVIVNTTSFDLNLSNGTVSKLLLQNAGDVIQTELRQKYPKGFNKNDCKVAVSTSGKLYNGSNIKSIFHIALDNYNPDTSLKIETDFKQILIRILELADEKKYESIALPAIGTGILKYPRDKVAQWMYNTMKDYLEKMKNTTIKKIAIVLFDKDVETIKAFDNIVPKMAPISIPESEEINSSDDENDEIESQKASRPTESKSVFQTVSEAKNHDLKLKLLNLVSIQIYIGNITNQSRDDVMVNLMKPDFNEKDDLINSAGIQTEIAPPKNGIFWTSAGNLPVKKILHVVTKSDTIKESIGLSLLNINKDSSSVLYLINDFEAFKTNSKDFVRKILKGFAIFVEAMRSTLKIKNIKVCIDARSKESSKIYENFKNEMKSITGYSNKTALKRLNAIFKDHSSDINDNDESNKEKLILQLISDEESKIESAKKEIDEMLNREKGSAIITHKYAKSLNTLQEKEINETCKEYKVAVFIDKDTNQIKFFGRQNSLNKCISSATDLLNKYLNNSTQEAIIVAHEVQWEFTTDKLKWTPYSPFLNSGIENAFKNREKLFEFCDDFEEECYIDFEKYIQFKKSTRQPMCEVIRDDLSKKKLDIKLPETWVRNKNCDLEIVNPDTNEYQDILTELNAREFGNKKIIKIERVQNLRLYIQYEAHKDHFEKRDPNNVNEKTLFHGTTGGSVSNIWRFGFNRSYCGLNATFFGKGVYFARDASYSHRYTNLGVVGKPNAGGNVTHGHLFLCKVLIGFSALGNKTVETKTLPKAPDGQASVDSTVDNISDPTIYVIYHDAQAYPRYLITYQ